MSDRYDEELRITKGGTLSFLHCPSCRGDNLHQEEVTAFWRQEDGEQGLKVTSKFSPFCEPGNPTSSISTELEGNPSSRRDGLRVRFNCETCQEIPCLIISQHKGSTFIHWEVPQEHQ